MRTFALLYLAIAASVALAAPAPSTDVYSSDDLATIVDNLPPDDTLAVGPDPGLPPPPVAPTEADLLGDASNQINASPAKLKRGLKLEKRYTTLSLPTGWLYAFQNLNGATEHPSYITYKSLPETTPDFAQAGAQFCNSVAGCSFFNIYTEKFGPNPADQVIKCSLYSLPSTAAQATNTGQMRDGYAVTISGSWGFSKRLNPSVPGYNAEPLDGAINGKRANPTDPDPYMGYASIEATDPNLCAQACEAKTAFDSRHPSGGTYKACNFFNFYILLRNSVPYKTICSFYLIPFDNSFAVNHGYTTGPFVYTIDSSWGYTRVPQQGTGGIVTVAP